MDQMNKNKSNENIFTESFVQISNPSNSYQ